MIEWAFFPRTQRITPLGQQVIQVFEAAATKIDSTSNNHLIGVEYKEAAVMVFLALLNSCDASENARQARDELKKMQVQAEVQKR